MDVKVGDYTIEAGKKQLYFKKNNEQMEMDAEDGDTPEIALI